VLNRAVPTVRLRALGLLAGALLALAGCGSSSSPSSSSTAASTPSTTASTPAAGSQSGLASAAAAAGSIVGTSGPLLATLHATTHQPKVNQAWPIHVAAYENSKPASASISYEYLFGGAVVAHRSHYTFTGHFSDIIRWPASAVGYQLTFRAVVTSGSSVVNLDYPVQVST
jgi:hypothetical protein